MMTGLSEAKIVVLISANTEWRVVCAMFPDVALQPSPFGRWFVVDLDIGTFPSRVDRQGWRIAGNHHRED
jgi:hypothetical protein